MILSFVPTYLTETLGYSRDVASTSSVVSMAVMCALIPAFGAASDRLGRRPVLAASCVLALVLSYPLFALMGGGSPAAAVLVHVGLGLVLAIFLGSRLAAMNEMFDTRVRYGGSSLGYNLSVWAFGGTAPFLVTLLVSATGNNTAPAFYVMAAAAITLPIILTARETAPARSGKARANAEVSAA